MKVPFNRPSVFEKEFDYLADALSRGQISGDGYYTQQCSSFLESYLEVPKVLLTPSCTSALELAYLLIDIKENDEVILPSFTFPSTANAFVLRGARPKFVDIRTDTLNIDEGQIENSLSPHTKAISPMHYGGVPCEMEKILKIAAKHQLWVIEDAAQALGATWRGRKAGTFGDLNAFSFHETKNVSCGEGGALIIGKREIIKRSEILRQKGTNRAEFYRGEVDKYSWVDIGSSFVPSELQTAFLFSQLHHLDKIIAKRKRISSVYREALSDYQKKGILKLPCEKGDWESSYHLFYVMFEDEKTRDRVMNKLRSKGVGAIFHFYPLHLSKMGSRFGYREGDFPVSEKVSKCLLRLPVFNSMSDDEQNYVIESFKKAI